MSASLPRVMLFDPYDGGHHGVSLRLLIEYWQSEQLRGELVCVVPPELADLNPTGAPNVRVITLRAAELAQHRASATAPMTTFAAFVKTGLAAADRAAVEWNLFCQYAAQAAATHACLMYADSLLFALAQQGGVLAAAPCSFSALYFEPAFYDESYGALRDGAARLQERFILKRALEHPRLHTLFLHDPHAVEALKRVSPRAAYLFDPAPKIAPAPDAVQDLRARLHINADRRIFLVFGALNVRKGIGSILEAVSRLPPALGSKMCLLVIGKMADETRAAFEADAEAACVSGVQIITNLDFVPEAEVPLYFQLADVVLVVYPLHIGSSGVQVRAAAAGKPVLAMQDGLVGRLTREYRLGLTVNAQDPDSIAAALSRALAEPLAALADADRLRRFAAEHTVEEYARTVFHAALSEAGAR